MKATVALGLGIAAIANSACVSHRTDFGPMSSQRVYGPADYTVDWDLPETDYYWLPPETADSLRSVAETCGTNVVGFVFHHQPRPPQYAYVGFRFGPEATESAKACVIERLKAVRALTTYPKKS